MLAIITAVLAFLGQIVPGLAATIGDTVIKSRQTEAARQGAQDTSAVALGHEWLSSITEANRTRADVRKNEGAWGPMGIITFLVGLPIVYHVWLVVGDSTPFHPGLTTVLYVIPWIEWVPHRVGSWGVATLADLAETEKAILQALFFVAPPAAAAVVVARAFRR